MQRYHWETAHTNTMGWFDAETDSIAIEIAKRIPGVWILVCDDVQLFCTDERNEST